MEKNETFDLKYNESDLAKSSWCFLASWELQSGAQEQELSGEKFGDIMLTLQISPSFSCNCSLAVYCPFLLSKSAASSPMLLLIFSFRGFNAYEKVSKLESTACWLSSEWASQMTPFFFFCSQRTWEDSSDYWHPFNLPQSQQGFLLLLLKFSRASREWEAHCALEVTRHVEERRGKL